VSNWARSEAARCRHNLLYWTNADWWGLGPGAHSHVGGVRWWNVKHPARYAALTQARKSPGLGREILTDAERHTERVLLGLRLADGLPAAELDLAKVANGLVRVENGRATLTLRGRLMADAVVRDLLT
jgi:coproporphyrinogen III oxidase-like Fe-S oxidoreductase